MSARRSSTVTRRGPAPTFDHDRAGEDGRHPLRHGEGRRPGLSRRRRDHQPGGQRRHLSYQRSASSRWTSPTRTTRATRRRSGVDDLRADEGTSGVSQAHPPRSGSGRRSPRRSGSARDDSSASTGPRSNARSSTTATGAGSYNEYETEKQIRVAQSFGSLFFVLLGAPVGILFAKRDFLSAFISCFVPIILLYYPLMLLGDEPGQGERHQSRLLRSGAGTRAPGNPRRIRHASDHPPLNGYPGGRRRSTDQGRRRPEWRVRRCGFSIASGTGPFSRRTSSASPRWSASTSSSTHSPISTSSPSAPTARSRSSR